MVRAASGTAFLRSNPVGSIRLKPLLVRNARTNPVRKNRARERRQTLTSHKPFGIQKAYPEDSSGMQRMQTPHFAGGRGSARIRSLVLRHFERETEAQLH